VETPVAEKKVRKKKLLEYKKKRTQEERKAGEGWKEVFFQRKGKSCKLLGRELARARSRKKKRKGEMGD